jgi:hypothetical protein
MQEKKESSVDQMAQFANASSSKSIQKAKLRAMLVASFETKCFTFLSLCCFGYTYVPNTLVLQ